MGIYDRDYYRSVPRGGFGNFAFWSITTWLIIVNVAVFFTDTAVQRMMTPTEQVGSDDEMVVPIQNAAPPEPLKTWGAFSINSALRRFQVWRFITFQFLHASPWHLVGNMIGLYFFGPIVEGHFGSRRYLAFYLLCGLAGAVTFLVMGYTRFLHVGFDTPLVGASAGIFGLLVAAAMIAPHVQIFYYLFPVTIRMLAIGGMLLAAYSVIAVGAYNAGGQAAHLGGGVLGFLFMKNQHWLNPFAGRAAPMRRQRQRVRALQKDWSKDFNR